MQAVNAVRGMVNSGDHSESHETDKSWFIVSARNSIFLHSEDQNRQYITQMK